MNQGSYSADEDVLHAVGGQSSKERLGVEGSKL